ncbi:dolichyl-phosphate-mannose--protein mannosyltransferase [Marinactinospora thermotolerans]|uniref:Polyprenol-phosphate-mannose--protein mannosyltransferase n=1 Tax=Marinactinospora thermotolerans DSM 45154 TaxID=1122192 RepID=A0A1T4SZX4_9ACTN|nr:phospholipid carrier-dependent glycosyltransferase [Marinactinospora thermotolerans]SKA33531.1 Dolichyl-phosphate-mannose--protein O-mannosyl transferase [Marinactinospora thermotolerans DSM 45154]
MTTTALTPAPAPGPSLRSRLVPPMPRPAWVGWLAAVLVALFAGALRFIRLGEPAQIYFDETYYAKDAFALREFGVEHESLENADELLAQGVHDIWTGGGDFVVHPPLGKWLIALGDSVWGLLPFGVSMSPTGWRVAAAFFGALSVLLLVRVALRMTRSVLLGATAGLIMALDGLHFTMSRIAMVDIFLMTWVLAGFACLVVDRDRTRARLAGLVDAGREPASWLGVRWWRIAAGLFLGLACATKWSALFYVAAFGLLTVAWDYGARRTAGQQRAGRVWFLADAVPAFFSIVGVAAVTYLASWAGWLTSSLGWGRGWAAQNVTGLWAKLPEPVLAVVNPLRSLAYYHAEIMSFHSGLSSPHDYASRPWEWIVMRTPVAFYYNGDETECGAVNCSSAILGIGSPAVWWLSIIACVVLLGWWVTYRDWRAGAVLLGAAASWLPWFAYPERTMFVFYALPMLPFLALAITLSLGLLMGGPSGEASRSTVARAATGVVFGVVMLLIVANFAYLYPVLSAEVIPYDAWADRMWFPTWIYGNASPE